MESGAIATQVITTTHHLGTTSVIAVASPIPGIPARATIDTGGGATTNMKASMRVNGTAPGKEVTITAIAAAMSTPILNGSEVRWVLRTAAST